MYCSKVHWSIPTEVYSLGQSFCHSVLPRHSWLPPLSCVNKQGATVDEHAWADGKCISHHPICLLYCGWKNFHSFCQDRTDHFKASYIHSDIMTLLSPWYHNTDLATTSLALAVDSSLCEPDRTETHEATFCEVRAEWLEWKHNINTHLQQVGSLQRRFLYLNSWLQHLLWLICLREVGPMLESLIFCSRVVSNGRGPPRLWGNCFFLTSRLFV